MARSFTATRLAHVFTASTRVSRGWYDPGSQKIIVQFPDGTRWAYYHVDRRTWDAFVQASSAGMYLNEVLNRHQNGPAGR